MAKVKFEGSIVTKESIKTAAGNQSFDYSAPEDLEEALEVDGEERAWQYYSRGRKLVWNQQTKADWLDALVKAFAKNPAALAKLMVEQEVDEKDDEEIEENEKE